MKGGVKGEKERGGRCETEQQRYMQREEEEEATDESSA